MAVSLDNASATRQLASGASSLSYSFTRGSGNGAVYINILHTNDLLDPSSVTFGGRACTKMASQTVGSLTYQAVYRLIVSDGGVTGAQTATITMGSSYTFILATTISFSGDIDTGINTHNATGTTITTLANPLSVGDQSWIMLNGAAAANDVTAGTNTTTATSANPLSGYFGPRSGAGSTSMSISSAGSDTMYSIAVEVAPAAGGGGGSNWGPSVLASTWNRIVQG